MTTEIKTFEALTTTELYDLLQLRTAVFVVEQNCVYQDLDGLDQKAYHVLGKKDGVMVAYTRIFKAGDYFDAASIGRVVVQKTQRKYGYGKDIMNASMHFITSELKERRITLSAQLYLQKFYEELGFQGQGETYLEDGIPHIKMSRDLL